MAGGPGGRGGSLSSVAGPESPEPVFEPPPAKSAPDHHYTDTVQMLRAQVEAG
ncbi:MAG TPA: hypothetical protein VHJ54_07635 [Solirubrobacterales bacterium]|jgi:hypothetical protein|nr:hypothetical protein [Solirubrobacterales bacterium]